MSLLEKVSRMALLQDFYGRLLTGRQQRIMELYYDQNYSLGEIAQEYKISRQAVYDILKRTEKILEGYEEKLGLLRKFQEDCRRLQEAEESLAVLSRDPALQPAVEKLRQIIYEIIDLRAESIAAPGETTVGE